MEADERLISRLAFYSSSRNTRVFRHEIRAQSETCLHREYNLAMKNKSPQLHNAPLEHRYACLGTADHRRAQWKALTRRARRVKNAEAFLNRRIAERSS